MTFADIALDGLGGTRYSLVFCSYALQLGLVSPLLLAASPHKWPGLTQHRNVAKIAVGYGQRVRMVLYRLVNSGGIVP